MESIRLLCLSFAVCGRGLGLAALRDSQEYSEGKLKHLEAFLFFSEHNINAMPRCCSSSRHLSLSPLREGLQGVSLQDHRQDA